MLQERMFTSMQGDKLILQHVSIACTCRRLKGMGVVGEHTGVVMAQPEDHSRRPLMCRSVHVACHLLVSRMCDV